MRPDKARKTAAAKLGIELYKRYRNLVEASGADEINHAAIELGALFNDNIEFVVWALKTVGGLNPQAPEPVKIRPNIPVPAPEKVVIPVPPCQCPPLEPGIIGYRHMASCPHFEPKN